MANSDWKDKLANAFNIDPNSIIPDEANDKIVESSLPVKQNLTIMLDKRNRNGKAVTLIVDFVGDDDSLKKLAKEIKAQCGAGGSARCGEILIQGDFRNKVRDILINKGYKARII